MTVQISFLANQNVRYIGHMPKRRPLQSSTTSCVRLLTRDWNMTHRTPVRNMCKTVATGSKTRFEKEAKDNALTQLSIDSKGLWASNSSSIIISYRVAKQLWDSIVTEKFHDNVRGLNDNDLKMFWHIGNRKLVSLELKFWELFN